MYVKHTTTKNVHLEYKKLAKTFPESKFLDLCLWRVFGLSVSKDLNITT